jgi:hypothetical protein
MKKLLILLFLLEIVMVTNSRAEIGIGLGSSGITVKPMHQYILFTTLRSGIGAGYSIESFDLSITPEICANLKFLQHEDYFLYSGLGVKGFSRVNIGSNDDLYNFSLYFMMPVGLECRPIPGNENLAVCIEAQVNFARSGTLDPGLYGVFEIVYYFNLKKE